DHDVPASLGPLPLETQPRPVLRPGRDGDRQSLLDAYLARAVAGGTRLRRHAPAAAAHGTWPRDGEPALAERDGAAAFTFGTSREGGAGRASRPAARRAYLRQRERDGHPATQCGDAERNGDRGLDLVLVLGTRAAAAPPENRREEIAEPAERAQIGEVELHAGAPGRARPTPAAPGAGERAVAAQLVVLLPLLGIAQHVVRFVDLLEALRGLRLVGVTVGMVLLREPAKRLLDLVRGRRLGHAENLIIVPLRCHLLFPLPPSLVLHPLQHHHPRRPDQGTPHLISRLQHRPHRVILPGMVRG